MKIVLFVILIMSVFVVSPAFAEEQLELLVSPFIGESLQPGNHHEFFIIRDVKNSMTWELAHPEIVGLDYVEGNTYLITAKKSFTIPLAEHQKYELIEIKQVFSLTNHIPGRVFVFQDIMYGLMETVCLHLGVVNMHIWKAMCQRLDRTRLS